MDATIIGPIIAAVGAIIAAVISAYKIRAKAKGKLEISDIVVSPHKKAKTCLLDFRVHNTGRSDVVINRVSLLALSVQSVATYGYLEFSKVYDLDISALGKDETIESPLSQVVQPGEIDRFGITLIARKMATGMFRGWKLQPTLHTNFGDVLGDPVEVWLPYKLPEEMIQEEKKAQVKATRKLEEYARQLRDMLRDGETTNADAAKELARLESLIKDRVKFGF